MVTMKQLIEWYVLGDACVVEELIYLNPSSEELCSLEIDCWKHEEVNPGGESYDMFKERYISIVKKYVKDWNEAAFDGL